MSPFHPNFVVWIRSRYGISHVDFVLVGLKAEWWFFGFIGVYEFGSRGITCGINVVGLSRYSLLEWLCVLYLELFQDLKFWLECIPSFWRIYVFARTIWHFLAFSATFCNIFILSFGGHISRLVSHLVWCLWGRLWGLRGMESGTPWDSLVSPPWVQSFVSF